MEKLIEMRDALKASADVLDEIITTNSGEEQTEDKQEELLAKLIVKLLKIQQITNEL